MKTESSTTIGTRALTGPALLLGLLLVGAGAWAQSGSPVGTVWDCVLSGQRGGIAYLTFSTNDNGAISGYEILVPQPPETSREVPAHDNLGGDGRGVRPPPTQTTNLYGAFPVRGAWGFDTHGGISGRFLEAVTDESCITNTTPISTNQLESAAPLFQTNTFQDRLCVTFPTGTNALAGTYTNQTVCYELTVTCGGFTNVVNFTGKVSGKRLSLTCKTPLGTVTMRGVPAVRLGSLSGEWSGVCKQHGASSYEFLTLTNSPVRTNTYVVSGSGPDFTYTGFASLSSQKKLALAISLYNLDHSYRGTRAVVGPFNPQHLAANATGTEAQGGSIGSTNRVRFQVTKRTTLP
jgi:hypothetical protein